MAMRAGAAPSGSSLKQTGPIERAAALFGASGGPGDQTIHVLAAGGSGDSRSTAMRGRQGIEPRAHHGVDFSCTLFPNRGLRVRVMDPE